MHYCVLLITKELPSEDEIANIMEPYRYCNIDFDNRPVFTWDWYGIGGRYNGSLKLKVDKDDEYYNWKYYEKGGRNKKLFYSYLLSKVKAIAEECKHFSWTCRYDEEDFYGSMGYQDGYLYVDGARVDDLLNFEEQNCYICIDANGDAIAREFWDGTAWIKDEHFDEKLEEIKKHSKGMFITVLDIHD